MSTLTPRDLAADLKVSVYTAQDYLKAGVIGGAFQVVPGGPWRIDAELYEAWKAEKAAAPTDPHKFSAPSARSQAASKRRKAA